ncbi:MFS transporter [Bowdeniella massiliensis]|uniref:MFS transporter n=1 Tax=Bowdeniella massiliensis TaxID=2932264 RepID=UPI002028BA23|nr:MFS transporter [Bowdeniella massiliensis]
MSDVSTSSYTLSPTNRRVFIGLLLGMLVSSISQTIVGPAMPRIVAELGGMDHYSWLATSAMLVSAITVPIVGKLSDMYARRRFYLGGLTKSVVALCCLAAFGVNMLMFGATIYIPVFAQGVLGVSATSSGAILVPMSAAMILTSIAIGLLISKTGTYKAITLLGVLIMTGGIVALTLLDETSAPLHLTGAMVIFGLGLGACMQVYTLLVQNAVRRTDLGVATAATQFFRNVGATVGIAVFGTIMTSRMAVTIPAHLPPGAEQHMGASAGEGVGNVLDPAALPVALVVLIATALIANNPLRDAHEN